MKYSYKIYCNSIEAANNIINFYDIGTTISQEDYLRVENSYINLVIRLYRRYDVHYLKVKSLENYEHLEYNEGEHICINRVPDLMRDILRERIWCKLIAKHFEIHFGYDYCMYLLSSTNLDFLKDEDTRLDISDYVSPYL